MTDETTRKKLIDRITKLFRLGEHVATDGQKGTTEAEMMAAVTKARQMMLDHGVTMAEIEANKGGDVTARIDARVRAYGSYVRAGKLAPYDWEVAFAVGTLTETRVLRYLGAKMAKHSFRLVETEGVLFLGDEDDTAVANDLFIIWLKDVRRMARAAYGGGNAWGRQHTSYAVGLGLRLKQRASEIFGSTQYALVVRAKQDAIDRWTQRHSLLEDEKKKKKRERKWDHAAMNRGYQDGRDFNMEKKIIR